MAISNKERITSYNERLSTISDQLDMLPQGGEDLSVELAEQAEKITALEEALAGKAGVASLPTQDKEVTADTEVITVSADEGYSLGTVTVNPTPSESKEVTAGTEVINVLPDEGKLLSEVTVNPTPSESKEITAGTEVVNVLPDEGKLLSEVVVNPIPSQEKTVTAGITMINIEPDNGKLLNKVTVNPTPSQSKTVTPSNIIQTITPDEGKLLSSVIVNGDSNLISENIKNGVDIFGIIGSMSGGLDLSYFGCTKMVIDSFSFPTDKYSDEAYMLPHSLGEVPKVIFMVANGPVSTSGSYLIRSLGFAYATNATNGRCWVTMHYTATDKINNTSAGYSGNPTSVDNNMVYPNNDTIKFQGGVEYLLITMA